MFEWYRNSTRLDRKCATTTDGQVKNHETSDLEISTTEFAVAEVNAVEVDKFSTGLRRLFDKNFVMEKFDVIRLWESTVDERNLLVLKAGIKLREYCTAFVYLKMDYAEELVSKTKANKIYRY